MKKTNYELGQIPTVGDMNDQHLLTEQALSYLVESITGGLQTVLLSNTAPSVTKVGLNWQIVVPEQYAAVDGRFFKILKTTLFSVLADKQIGVYFILKETGVTDARERIRDTGSTLVRESFTPTVRLEETSRVVLSESSGPTQAPPPPALAPDDVGYIEYVIVISNGGSATVNHNTTQLWTFPGGGMAVAAHGTQHLPSGSDPVPQAALGGPSGSSAGILPSGMLAVIKDALQDISISSLSPYMVRTTSGDNTLTNPKISTIQLRHHTSLEIKDPSSQPKLGVKFASGGYYGTSETAARLDHGHAGMTSIEIVKVAITATTELGTIVPLTPFNSMADISSVKILWSPPGTVSPSPGIECGWFQDPVSQQFIGVRPILMAPNEVHLEIGNGALLRFQDVVRLMILAQFTGGSVTWNGLDSNTPMNGVLFVKVIGARS